MSPKRILVIRLSSIGDILLTTPFIRQIHKKFPRIDIDYVVKSDFEELVRYNPYIRKVHVFDTSSNHALKRMKIILKEKKYDCIFDLHNNFRSIFLRTGLSSSYLGIVKKDKIRQLSLLYFKLNFYKEPKPIPQRYLETGLKLGKIAQPVRVALTGKTASPGIFEIIAILGPERVIPRLDKAIRYIEGLDG